MLILWLFISDDRVCVRAYVRYDTGAPSVFFFSLPLLFHSLSLSRARSNNQVFTQLCNDGDPTVRSSRQRASVRASVCLLVGTGADRKITTADRCSASVCLHFSIFAPTPTHTLHLCTECVCFGKIFDKRMIVTTLLRGCSDSGFTCVTRSLSRCRHGPRGCVCVYLLCVLLPHSM